MIGRPETYAYVILVASPFLAVIETRPSAPTPSPNHLASPFASAHDVVPTRYSVASAARAPFHANVSAHLVLACPPVLLGLADPAHGSPDHQPHVLPRRVVPPLLR